MTPTTSAKPPVVSAETRTPVQDAARFLVIPGEQVGDMTATTSREDLARLFGEDNLTDEEVHVGEGFFEQGTRVNLDEGRSFTVLWSDESRTAITEVRDFGPAWKLPEGIGIGTRFATLQDVLGSFQLHGFGWDYGGTLSLDGTSLEGYADSLVLRVGPASEVAPSDYSDAIMGDQLLSDSNPDLRSLDLQVREMIVYLNP